MKDLFGSLIFVKMDKLSYVEFLNDWLSFLCFIMKMGILRVRLIGYCTNTTFYDRGHVSDALPSLRGNALLRHERGHKMLYLYNNLIIIYAYKINRNNADTR